MHRFCGPCIERWLRACAPENTWPSCREPLGSRRQEGEPAASQLRQGLDRVSPGLGNPVMKVEVHDVAAEAADPQDALELQQGLARIAERLELLEQRLESD